MDSNDHQPPSSMVKSTMPKYRIRRMRMEDVEEVLKIWAENDLHEGIDTIQSFMRADPHGFVVAVQVDDQLLSPMHAADNNEREEEILSEPNRKSRFPSKQICCCVIQEQNSPPSKPSSSNSSSMSQLVERRILGMCAAVFIHPSIAFIGLYAVRPELHGRGIGLQMWSRIMDHVADRNAGLYAVVQHLSMYRDRAGFGSPDERLLYIYESEGTERQPLNIELLVQSIRGIEIRTIDEERDHCLYDSVIRYDASVHGYSRHKLLPHVLKEKGSVALVAIDIDESNEQCGEQYSVVGFGCIRTNNIGKAMIGPLYAMNDAVAELLMFRLFDALSGPFSKGLLYMTLDSNPGGERIAEKIGIPKHEELPRFFRQQPYKDAKWLQVYCIHSPNFSLL